MSPVPPVTPPPGAEQRCDELVDMVTDYLEGALAPADRALVEAHLDICDGCTTVVAQWREVIRQTGRLAAGDVDGDVDTLDPATRTRLLTAFRDRSG